jgi:hypothetical protein
MTYHTAPKNFAFQVRQNDHVLVYVPKTNSYLDTRNQRYVTAEEAANLMKPGSGMVARFDPKIPG